MKNMVDLNFKVFKKILWQFQDDIKQGLNFTTKTDRTYFMGCAWKCVLVTCMVSTCAYILHGRCLYGESMVRGGSRKVKIKMKDDPLSTEGQK